MPNPSSHVVASSSAATNESNSTDPEKMLIEFSQRSESTMQQIRHPIYTPICNLRHISAQNELALQHNLLILTTYIASLSKQPYLSHSQGLLDLLCQYQTHPGTHVHCDMMKLRCEFLTSQDRFEEAIQLANSLSDPHVMLETTFSIGEKAYEKQKFTEVQHCFEKCLTLITTHPDIIAPNSLQLQIYFFLANIHYKKAEEILLFLEYCNKAIDCITQIAEEKSGKLSAKEIYIYLQVENLLMEFYGRPNNTEKYNTEKIQTHCNNVIEHANQILDSPHTNSIFASIGCDIDRVKIWRNNAYLMIGISALQDNKLDIVTNHKGAKNCFTLAAINDKEGRILHARGMIALLESKYSEALHYFLTALKENFEMSAFGLMTCYTYLENYPEAIKWFTFLNNKKEELLLFKTYLDRSKASSSPFNNSITTYLWTFTFNSITNSLLHWCRETAPFSPEESAYSELWSFHRKYTKIQSIVEKIKQQASSSV